MFSTQFRQSKTRNRSTPAEKIEPLVPKLRTDLRLLAVNLEAVRRNAPDLLEATDDGRITLGALDGFGFEGVDVSSCPEVMLVRPQICDGTSREQPFVFSRQVFEPARQTVRDALAARAAKEIMCL